MKYAPKQARIQDLHLIMHQNEGILPNIWGFTLKRATFVDLNHSLENWNL